jgi:hypothetical protein
MTTPLQLRQTGYRLPQGEWFNVIINLLNSFYGSKSIQIVKAAGATQGNATSINSNLGLVVKVTVTASTEGIKLPVASTGFSLEVYADPSVGVKVYPATGGIINAAATNAAFTLVKAKGAIFTAFDKTHWRVIAGA